MTDKFTPNDKSRHNFANCIGYTPRRKRNRKRKERKRKRKRAMADNFKPGLFQGKVAIVTGGGTGIGRAIAVDLLRLGCCVVVSGRREEKLKEMVEEVKGIRGEGWGEVEYVVCDIRKEEMVSFLFLFFSFFSFLFFSLFFSFFLVVFFLISFSQVKNMMGFTMTKFKRLDFLVNNGGGQFPSRAENIRSKVFFFFFFFVSTFFSFLFFSFLFFFFFFFFRLFLFFFSCFFSL